MGLGWLVVGVGLALATSRAHAQAVEVPPAQAERPAQAEPEPEPEPEQQPEVVIFGALASVPHPKLGLDLRKVPRNVQRLDRSMLDDQHALGAHDALNARLGSVVLNDVQNNPMQPDLQYRGFTASPLLGAPQGIAVYQNGVRVHDPLGDVVQWDLVPEHAIHDIELVPGANPLYGQNALGGGLSLRMKNAFNARPARVVGSAGAFGRYKLSGEYAERWSELGAYLSASVFGEEGFRDHSASWAQHAYADFRRRSDTDEIGLSLALAQTSLNGNGPAPFELLRQDRAAVFTYPDNTRNDSLLLNIDARKLVFDDVTLSGNLYVRYGARGTLNGDEAELEACAPEGVEILCDDDDEPVLTEARETIDVPEARGIYDAVYNSTQTVSAGYGATAQLSFDGDVGDKPNQFIVGTSLDRAHAAFSQHVELGYLTDARGVSGQGIFVGNDGFRTRLDVNTHNAGLYAVDTFTLLDPLAVQVAARLNYTQLELIDRLGDALDGEHDFLRINPSSGITYRVIEPITLFASYAEGSRAPSAIELACADPDEPCRVPNAFLSDPPLEQVVTRALELGVRGMHGRSYFGRTPRPQLEWSLAAFGSRNLNDILFVAGSRVGTGYFRNAGVTQRAGVELSAAVNHKAVEAYASYTLLRATFESPLELSSPAHPFAQDGVVQVEPGDRLPGIPTHSFKAGIGVRPLEPWKISMSMIAQSDRPYRGDEAGLLPGVQGHAVFAASTSYQVLPQLELFVKAENLFDVEYETFGLLGEPDDVLEGAEDPRFQSPGAPLGVWGGIVLRD